MSTSFSPTPAEATLVGQIFAQADTSKLGILKGDDAVHIFGGAKVPPTVLGEIWNIADEDQNGWLSRKGAAVALRLIGWAQKGEKVSKELVNKPGPIPVIEGFSPITAHHTGMSIPKSPPPGTGLPLITQADKTKFHNMFLKAGPVNGLLNADQARDIFLKSKLSNDTLLHVWNLADTQDRGTLDATDFALGMYFIQGLMQKTMTTLPDSLPPGLYQQAQLTTVPLSQNLTGTRSPSSTQASFPQHRAPIQPQYTGQAASVLQPQGTGMALPQQSTGMLQQHNTGMGAPKRVPPTLPARPNASQVGTGAFSNVGSSASNWDVTAEEKANSDRYFDTLDSSKQGIIEGDVAVPFMLESKLPDDVLAHIWDLSDLYNNGRLTKDCFAVAMHLIQKKLGGGELPTTIPQSLIPPAMRTTAIHLARAPVATF
ncbi:EF-hand [Marasmius fiardii PR-910]|nr:EF-hand [Marasmius fiardii PR-910]